MSITRTAPATTADLARIFKALGDPTRLAIFETIRSGVEPGQAHSGEEIEQSIGQIASHFGVSLSTVSHHIKELRTAGLLRCERRGQSIFCSVEPTALDQVDAFMARR